MKRVLLLGAFFLAFLQSSFASEKEIFGYLQSGDGFCSIELTEQNEYLYQLIYTSKAMTVRASNIELTNGMITGFDEAFDREGNFYDQLLFDIPFYPRTYRIKMKNLGKGRFYIEKKTSIFGQVSFKHTDICITKHIR